MVSAHAHGLFPARMPNENYSKYAKNMFYNVKINAKRVFFVLAPGAFK